MKLLLLPLLLVGASAGWYGLGSPASETPAACESENCRVTVECTDHGTCLVTCYDANGDVQCQKEVDCDRPCDKACDEPCDSAAEKSTSKACVPGPGCTR